MDIRAKIEFLMELISCSHRLSYGSLDASLNLLSTSCPSREVYDILLSQSGYRNYLLPKLSSCDTPWMMTDVIGFVWIAVFERSHNKVHTVHLIGPACFQDAPLQALLNQNVLPGKNAADTLTGLLCTLPILSFTDYLKYGQMLHYTVTGQKVLPGSFYLSGFPPQSSRTGQATARRQSHAAWACEQALTRAVKEGRRDDQTVLDEFFALLPSCPGAKNDPVRQTKEHVRLLLFLCSRAALLAGLPPHLAYTLQDTYLQDIEAAVSAAKIRDIGQTVFRDFADRVQNTKAQSAVSMPIRDICDYIRLHCTEKYSIADLGRQAGYAEYYFSKKFKKETGMSVNDFIKQAKIEHAKKLLLDKTSSIQQISEALQFCSQSYFAEVFQHFTGMSPGDYRNRYAAPKKSV